MFDQEVICRDEDDLRDKIAEWQNTVLDLRLPVSIGAGHDISKNVSTLMAHCYRGFLTGGKCSHSLLVRAVGLGSSTVFEQTVSMRNKLLDAGVPVSVQDGAYITHLFHKGRHPGAPNIGWISFGVRMSDEDAIKLHLSENATGSGYQLMAINGRYYRDIHP